MLPCDSRLLPVLEQLRYIWIGTPFQLHNRAIAFAQDLRANVILSQIESTYAANFTHELIILSTEHVAWGPKAVLNYSARESEADRSLGYKYQRDRRRAVQTLQAVGHRAGDNTTWEFQLHQSIGVGPLLNHRCASTLQLQSRYSSVIFIERSLQ